MMPEIPNHLMPFAIELATGLMKMRIAEGTNSEVTLTAKENMALLAAARLMKEDHDAKGNAR